MKIFGGVKSLLTLVFVMLLPGGMAGNAHAQSTHPNLIIVLCDDLGYGDLACYGNKVVTVSYTHLTLPTTPYV